MTCLGGIGDRVTISSILEYFNNQITTDIPISFLLYCITCFPSTGGIDNLLEVGFGAWDSPVTDDE
jgi:hypothetical protein